MLPKPQFFPTLTAWRAWLEAHHAERQELWVGFYKRDSGRPSITWPEAVDGALCFGWIDGVRKSIDEVSYKIRFTPRKPRSVWSAINIKRVGELRELRQMHPAGLAAFEKRDSERSAIYSYEQRKTAKLTAEYEKKFRANTAAWKFFQSQPSWYQRTSTYWVISAKKEATRLSRLDRLISDSGHKRTIAPLTRPAKSKQSK
jgi:uncharacterized protein YdeI (YjbR/CyaY-like superfamily)